MKSFSFYVLLFSAVLLVAGCGNDDDGDGGGGTGGADGDLIVRLTWEQADADLDLEFDVLPSFNVIPSFSGDDTSGPGEEVFTFSNNAEDGPYTVSVEWFSGAGDVSYTLVIQSAETGRTFTETVNASNDFDTFSFTKNGRTLTF
ncbi:MAG: hypothetical protein AAFQ37_00280 [Bacteroidota bacterium]